MPSNLISDIKAELSETKPRINSGFTSLDESISGFRAGNLYIMTGLKKSGKSSFLMNMAINMVRERRTLGYINTELTKSQFFSRLVAIDNNQNVRDVEDQAALLIPWVMEHEHSLLYAEKTDIKDESGLSLGLITKKLDEWVFQGAEAVFIDNLTSFTTEANGGMRGWEILAKTLDRLIDYAREKRIVIFAVVHVKDQTVFTESPQGIRSILKAEEPERIFDESVTVNRRPTSADIYGGGGAKSQISGGILLLWRPYQDANLSDYQKLSLLILEDFRDGATTNQIRLNFDLPKLRFYEIQEPKVSENMTDQEISSIFRKETA